MFLHAYLNIFGAQIHNIFYRVYFVVFPEQVHITVYGPDRVLCWSHPPARYVSITQTRSSMSDIQKKTQKNARRTTKISSRIRSIFFRGRIAINEVSCKAGNTAGPDLIKLAQSTNQPSAQFFGGARSQKKKFQTNLHREGVVHDAGRTTKRLREELVGTCLHRAAAVAPRR